jgi:KDO2-lipid IV(A) lauroyltransferase
VPQFYLVPKRLARKAPILEKIAYRVEAFAFRTIFALIRHLNLDNALKLTGWAFVLSGRFSDKAQKAMDNLAVAFPDKDEAWRRETTREIFRSVGYSAVELIKLDQIWEEREQRIEFVYGPRARELAEKRTPTLYMTAHVGPWQVAPMLLRRFNVTINTIYAPESNPVMNELMKGLRKSFGENLISSEDGPRPIMRELKAGNSVIMAMDTRPDQGKLLPFFGREALTNTSAVGLALRTGAAVVLGRGERLAGGRYRLTLYDPIESPIPDAPVKEQSAAMTEIIHGHFEQWIREYPEQWVCLKRRWPKAHKL